MSSKFGYTNKEKREIKEGLLNRIEKDIRDKKNMEKWSKVSKYDEEIFEKGVIWFIEGMSLDDAPENIKNNSNFIRGYEKGRRLALIEELKISDEKNGTRGSR